MKALAIFALVLFLFSSCASIRNVPAPTAQEQKLFRAKLRGAPRNPAACFEPPKKFCAWKNVSQKKDENSHEPKRSVTASVLTAQKQAVGHARHPSPQASVPPTAGPQTGAPAVDAGEVFLTILSFLLGLLITIIFPPAYLVIIWLYELSVDGTPWKTAAAFILLLAALAAYGFVIAFLIAGSAIWFPLYLVVLGVGLLAFAISIIFLAALD